MEFQLAKSTDGFKTVTLSILFSYFPPTMWCCVTSLCSTRERDWGEREGDWRLCQSRCRHGIQERKGLQAAPTKPGQHHKVYTHFQSWHTCCICFQNLLALGFMITFKTLLLFANSLKHTVAVLNEHLEALGKKYETMVQKTVDTRWLGVCVCVSVYMIAMTYIW